MNVLFLGSARPCFETGTAVNVVFASLLASALDLGSRVSWAVALPDKAHDEKAERLLREKGARFIGDFSSELSETPMRRPWRTLRTLRKVIWPRPSDDLPSNGSSDKVVETLRACRADATVLFWDTWFEHLLPGLRNETTIVYGARPRHAAAVTRLQQGMRTPRLLSRLRDPLTRRLLRHQERRHYSRLAYAGALANICAVDADSYRRHGLGCTYLPNTWPDAFGKDWSQKRSAAEAAYGSIGILGNVSSVEATGNVFGMRYLANQVLPLMDKALHGVDWTLNITGSGVLAEDLALAFQRDRVRVKGFVPSLDQEVLANSIFLLLNNAGPYTGGYTRVVYAMSSGSCLIAHRRLADSMPEVRHGENALLGESPREIAEHLARACNDGALRQRLGENARRTYEREYHPRVVTQRLLGLVKTAVHA